MEERRVSVSCSPAQCGGEGCTTPTPSTPDTRGGGGIGVCSVPSLCPACLRSVRDGVAECSAMFVMLTMRRRVGADGRLVEDGEVTSCAGRRAGWVSKPKRVDLAKA